MGDPTAGESQLGYAGRRDVTPKSAGSKHVWGAVGAACGLVASLPLSYPFSAFPAIWPTDPFPIGKYLKFAVLAIRDWIVFAHGNSDRLDPRFEGPFIKEWLPFAAAGLVLGYGLGLSIGWARVRRRAAGKRQQESAAEKSEQGGHRPAS